MLQQQTGDEFGGIIYLDVNNKISSTIPVQGRGRHWNFRDALPFLPDGAIVISDYHTHLINNYFSEQDVSSANGLPEEYSSFQGAYIFGPSGIFYYESGTLLNDDGTIETILKYQRQVE